MKTNEYIKYVMIHLISTYEPIGPLVLDRPSYINSPSVEEN